MAEALSKLAMVRTVLVKMSRGLLLQGARYLPLVQCPAHGQDRRPPGRSRLPAPTGAPVCAFGAQAAALVSKTGANGDHCCAAYLPAGVKKWGQVLTYSFRGNLPISCLACGK